jgi:hypothetical protein
VTGAGGVIPTRPTGLIAKFSPADIEVRISALKALGKFGEGLAALAGSDAPQRAGKSVEEIGDSVQSISNHVGSLSGQKSSRVRQICRASFDSRRNSDNSLAKEQAEEFGPAINN